VTNTNPIEPTQTSYLPNTGETASRPLQCATLRTFAAGRGLPALPSEVAPALRCGRGDKHQPDQADADLIPARHLQARFAPFAMRDVENVRGGQRTARPTYQGSARTPLAGVVANASLIELTQISNLPGICKPASRPLQCATLGTFTAGRGLPARPTKVAPALHCGRGSRRSNSDSRILCMARKTPPSLCFTVGAGAPSLCASLKDMVWLKRIHCQRPGLVSSPNYL